uniref:Uncharacterized protein n=1 Tax=Cacopsylla melanoneura TaxID=428564 RepID=A0A8D9DX30_9HEMI
MKVEKEDLEEEKEKYVGDVQKGGMIGDMKGEGIGIVGREKDMTVEVEVGMIAETEVDTIAETEADTIAEIEADTIAETSLKVEKSHERPTDYEKVVQKGSRKRTEKTKEANER